MPVNKIILLIYGLLLIGGAFLGLKAGSKISLIMGLVSGALVFLGLFLTGTNPRLGFLILTLVSGLLSATFLIRYLKTQKIMPSLALFILSIIALGVSLYSLFSKKQ